MRGALIAAFAVFVAAFAFAGAKPAAALPATAAIDYGTANAGASGDLVEVKRWYKRGPYWRRPHYRPYYRPYRYYRPYGYYRPYYRPYRYYRPGVSIWLGW